MPNEYDSIIESKDRAMSEEQYISMRGQYEKKIDEIGTMTRKLILIFLGAYAVSFVLLYLRLLFGENAEFLNNCYILLAGLLLAVFFYDPKQEDKKTTYEKDKRILLEIQKNKTTALKIRLGLVIGFGSLFAILNIVWWAVFGFMPDGESLFESSLRSSRAFSAAALEIDYSYMESEPVGETEKIEESGENDREIDATMSNSIIMRVGSPKALVNGETRYIEENNRSLAPFIDENDRTLVPVRFIAESLGYGIEFDFEAAQKKIMIYDDVTEGQHLRLSMSIGENTLQAGDFRFKMDTAPVLTSDGRTFIPARPFAEGLFMHISYVESERIIIIARDDIGNDADPKAKMAAGNLPVWPIEISKVLKEWKNWPANPDGSYHAGADFAIEEGSDVYSAYSGIVEDVLDLGNFSYGKLIVVKSEIGGLSRYIYYGHLSAQFVSPGENVIAGDIIGKTGSTGNSTGPHLHYEVRDENKSHGSPGNPALNPYDYLP